MPDYTPGDVYAVDVPDYPTDIGIIGHHAIATEPGPHLLYPTGGWDHPDAVNARRLAVIDPENREQIERLALLLCAEDAEVNWAQAKHALRAYTNPKPAKPAEPTGLGAVVEDADGDRWVLNLPGGITPWTYTTPNADEHEAEWDDIDVVKVLSEGVPS